MKKTWKKAVSALLTLAMVLSVAPVTALAEDAVAKIGETPYTSLADALKAAEEMTGDVTITLTGDVEWETGASHGSTPLIGKESGVSSVTIDGQEEYTLTATGAGVGSLRAANGGKLIFKGLYIDDESESYAENSWEFTYLEFAGNLEFNRCAILSGISLDTDNGQAEGVNAKFVDCAFESDEDSVYCVWVGHGDVTFEGCSFTGTRGAKIHEDYGSEVDSVTFDDCAFKELTKKPGLAIGDLNEDTVVTIKDCVFDGVQAGDQNKYIYESDTDVNKFDFKLESNAVLVEDAVAEIDGFQYATLEDAFKDAEDGDKVKVLKEGTYALSTSGKNITITGAVDGVVFEMGGATPNMVSADITFNNVTFNWDAGTWPYHGLQHCGNMEYNDCTINGSVWLYGPTETFNDCVFDVKGDAYNVNTYGAKNATFTDCTFNSEGKSVLIYNEGATDTKATFKNCKFKASKAVKGKAAIEIDSSFSNFEVEITECKMSGFADGSVSGQPRWNIKQPEITKTEVVDGKTIYTTGTYTVTINEVIEPVAKIVETGVEYATVQDAIDAAKSGETVKLIDNVTFDNIDDLVWTPCKSNGNGKYGKEFGNGGFVYVVGKDITFDLNGKTITYDLHDEEWCNKHVLSVFYVTDQGTLTITDSSNGKGEVEVNGMATAVYSVAAGTKAIVEGGTWTWNPCKECEATNIFLYASHGGELYIKDGYFENNAVKDSEYMIVEHGSSKETTESSAGVDYDSTKVEISGGDYKNYDPSKSMFIDQGNKGATSETDCCAEGYVSTLLKDGKTYRVHKEGTEAEPSTSSNKKSKKYDVIIKSADNGGVEVDDDYAKRGQEITITVDPDKGYELDELTITDQNGDEVDYEEGKKDNTFVFDMPKSDVTIEASFDKESSSVADKDDEDKEDKEDVSDKEDEDTSKGDDEEEYIRLTIGQKIVWMFDEYVVNDVAPEIKNERTMLPIRIIAEALGATVTWSEAEQKVTITEDDLVIEIFIGQPFATVNGEPVELDAPAYIANDRTYLPLRFVAENLGATVIWNDADKTVTIYE